jgi:hypothetical protein
MTDKITVTPYCTKCGASVVIPDSVPDDTVLECTSCGQRFGTVGDAKSKARAEARSALNAIFKPTFDAIERLINKS